MNLNTPPGVNPPSPYEKLLLYKAICGDDWMIDFSLFNPVSKQPATPINTIVTMVLTDNRFSYNTYWQGSWNSGMIPDARIPGLVHVLIPKSVTSRLRRGVYTYSIRVTDVDTQAVTTTRVGYIQVEYEATSPQHNIPYRNGVLKTSKNATQYVTEEELSEVVAQTLKTSSEFSENLVSNLVDDIVTGLQENPDPTMDELIKVLNTLISNLEKAKQDKELN